MTDEQTLRLESLRVASANALTGDRAWVIVDEARIFYQFLKEVDAACLSEAVGSASVESDIPF